MLICGSYNNWKILKQESWFHNNSMNDVTYHVPISFEGHKDGLSKDYFHYNFIQNNLRRV